MKKLAQLSENWDHGIRSYHFMANRWRNSGNSDRLYFGGLQNHYSHEIKRCLLLGRKAMTNLDSILKSRDITDKGLSSQSYGFSRSHIQIWELDRNEGWVPKNSFFWTVDAFGLLSVPWTSRKIKPANPKGNQPWIFIGSTDAEAETSILLSPDVKNWLIGKDPYPGKD